MPRFSLSVILLPCKIEKFKIFKDKIFIDLIAKLETLKANCLDDYQL
jgi:hypothetical protein